MANYILVENRQIVHLGPFAWNKYRMLQSELDDLEVSFTVPPVEQGYIRINDNFEIFPITDIVSPEIDPNFDQPIGPTWTFNDDHVIGTYEKQDKPLVEVRNTIKSVAAAIRYGKEAAGTKVIIVPEVTGEVSVPKLNEETGVFEETIETRIITTAVEVTADTSRDGRAIFVQVYSTLPDGASVDWKFPEGWMNITKKQLGLIIAGGFTYIQEQFVWEKSVGDSADAASTMDELKVIYVEVVPVVEPVIPGV